MPTVPMLSPEQMQLAQAQGNAGTGGINPANFLIAAAQMHNEGSLSMPKGDTTDPVPGKAVRANKRLKVIR